MGNEEEIEFSWFVAVTTYFGYAVLVAFGHLRDFTGRLFGHSRYLASVPPKGYAPLLKSWENFYTRRMYHRIQDCWNRPVSSSPGAHIDVMERTSRDGNKTMETTGETRACLNLGSYNYLGFADDWQETCSGPVKAVLDDFPVSCSSAMRDIGYTRLHRELERTVADFLAKEDSMVFNMGYGTNSQTLPAIMGKGSLIVSDSLNHTSIVNGSRASGAHIRTFKHNDPAHLESVLREAIALGMPRTHRPWKRILVMVEGIYSMEGEICDLRAVVDVAKKYKAYIYVDEAHSIGALGASGRGVTEYCGVGTDEIDILMGTFTKSFGGMGGYIASSQAMIDYLRSECSGFVYSNALSPVVCQQVITSFRVIQGLDGTQIGANKLANLRDNSNFFRKGLEDIGLQVYGDYDSPVIPVMLYNPTKIAAFSRECFDRGLAVVVVGFPATPLISSRARFCVSAGHTREDLELALEKIREVAEVLKLRYSISTTG